MERDYVVLLSDWTDEDPEHIYATLKRDSEYFNFAQRTVGDFFADARARGWREAFAQRRMWGQARMDPTDLVDVSGYTYTYLMNGVTPAGNWSGEFQRGERVRLRFINGSSMSFFDVRIPGLAMTVVAADGDVYKRQDMGFIPAIKRVLKLLPRERQNLMFSATYTAEVRELASRILRNPASIEVAAPNATAERVDHQVYRVAKDHKRHLLAHLIDAGNWHQVLVFTRTKHGANRLTKQLQSTGILATAIHGNKSQAARTKALHDFKTNKVTALVATEVAARGLDIKELPHVVNYDPVSYTHLFAQARAQQRFVLLDLEAVWCHWCHVMDETTYQDRTVAPVSYTHLDVYKRQRWRCR